MSNKTSAFNGATLLALLLLTGACGILISDKTKEYDKSHQGAISRIENDAKDGDQSLKPDDSNAIIPIKCKIQKSDLAFANSVYENLFRRSLTEAEVAKLSESKLDREKFVSDALVSGEASNGISEFLTNLFGLNTIAPRAVGDEELAAEGKLVSDLQKEPIELVLRNLDKPWDYFFTTQDIYCTQETAKIYKFSGIDSSSFRSCHLPSDRAGFLGLASVLRASPSTFISENNNYKRVAKMIYLATGVELFAATNGPVGDDGLGAPLAACVPATDVRVADSGLVYGTASVPAVGPVCASCHSRYNAPISVAFRHFNQFGEQISLEDIDDRSLVPDSLVTALGTNRNELKVILNESKSCWSKDGVAPPRSFDGIPGLGRLIVESGLLGQALGVQIPPALGNVVADPNMTSTIKKYYSENGKTLSAAIKGFLLSDSFQCQLKDE